MGQFMFWMLTLLFFVSSPAMKGNAEIGHSPVAAASVPAAWNEFRAATTWQFASLAEAGTGTGFEASALTKMARCLPTAPRPQLLLPAPSQPVALLPENAPSLGARGAETLPPKLYHYTGQGNAANILERGLQPGKISGKVFTTPTGTYTPIEAQMYLALPPNRGLPGALFEIDTATLRSMGINPSAGPMRVLPTPNAMGYGTEIIFDQAIPPTALRQIR